MKKLFFLSCLLIPVTAESMEKETKALTYSDIAHEVSKLDDELCNDKNWYKGSNNPLAMLVMCRFPKHEYGYAEENGAGVYYDGTLAKCNPICLKDMHRLKTANYNGYSGIGAVTLATTIDYNKRKKIIRKMLEAGFVPTEKDRLLALHLEQEEKHNLTDGKSDLLDLEEKKSELPDLKAENNNSGIFTHLASLYAWLMTPSDLTDEDKHDLHLG